ncbi:hypothetical protein HT031_000184 [Scenedesmus sp. PABB004]|nr:hypothetical protein HT031_000184 [Scenedesmus sp. PABB004]
MRLAPPARAGGWAHAGGATAAAPRAQQRRRGRRAARALRGASDGLADVTREVWDDEEDVGEAVRRLGLDRGVADGEPRMLLSEANRLYVQQAFPQAHVDQLELHWAPGRGYGVVAARDIAKGTLLAACPPLAWVAGAPGRPPRLEALMQHLAGVELTPRQRDVLHSLCSLPVLDAEHEAAAADRAAAAANDRLLAAAAAGEGAAPGAAASSLPASRSAAIKRSQRELRAKLQQRDALYEGRGGGDGERECEDEPPAAATWPRGAGLAAPGASGQRRRTPDLLELLECTAGPEAPGAAARPQQLVPAAAAAAAGALGMPPERLAALVCRNALAEMAQDLPVCSVRGDRPASLTGLWPLLAAFNHSCAPNAVAVLIGGLPPQPAPPPPPAPPGQGPPRRGGRAGAGARGPTNPWARGAAGAGSAERRGGAAAGAGLQREAALAVSARPGEGPFVLVRAVTDLKAGDEVTLDYLAPGAEGSMVHRERRRAALAQRWGFTCRCERCTAEAELGPVVERSQLAANALAARLGPQVPPALAAGDGGALASAAAALSGAVQQLERQVDAPTTPPRVAGWAHASIYQAHALLATVRLGAEPSAMRSLGAIGTAMELAGLAVPGGPSHLLGAAALLLAAHERWGGSDARVEAAARGLFEVLQLRYGPLEAGTTHQLALAAQHWAHQMGASRLGLVAPGAAAAARAAAALAAGAGPRGGGAAAAEAPTAAGAADEDDGLLAALELEADGVLEVSEELLEELYDDDDQREGRPQQDPDDGEALVRQRSEAEVRQQLEAFAGYAAALPPEQRARLRQQQAQQAQQQQAQQEQELGVPREAAEGAGEGAIESDAAGPPELPALAAWLSEGPARAAEEEDASGAARSGHPVAVMMSVPRAQLALAGLLALAALGAARPLGAPGAAAVPAWAGRRLAQAQCNCVAAPDVWLDVSGKSCMTAGNPPNCNAKDLTLDVASFEVVRNCTGPTSNATIRVRVSLTTKGDTRYAVGLFVGVNGVSPDNTNSSCHMSALPVLPGGGACGSSLVNADNDTCGDITKAGDASGTVSCGTADITVSCSRIHPTSGKLMVPICTSWDQQRSGTGGTGNNQNKPNDDVPCTGAGGYANQTSVGTTAKCNCIDYESNHLVPTGNNQGSGSGTTASPDATLALAAPAGPINATGNVTFTLTINNTGNVALTPNAVTLTGNAVLVSSSCNLAAPLAPGASLTCSVRYPVVFADLLAGNISVTASLSGAAPAEGSLQTVPPASAWVATNAWPDILVAVSAAVTGGTIDGKFDSVGDQITFTATLTNTGNVPGVLTLDGASCSPTTAVDPGSNATCTVTYPVTQADLEAGNVTRSFTGTDTITTTTTPSATKTATATANATVAGEQKINLVLTKTASPTSLSEPGLVTYTIIALNTGNVAVKSLAVSDAMLPGLSCSSASLRPGESQTCTGTTNKTFTQTEFEAAYSTGLKITNTASAAGVATNQNTAVGPVNATADVAVVYDPKLTVTVSCPVSRITSAQTVTCTVIITNAGNWGLSGLTATPSLGSGCNLAAVAAPGGTVTCPLLVVVNQLTFEVGDPIVVSVTASGKSNVAGLPISANDTASITVVLTPAVTVALSANRPNINALAPGSVTYTAVVSNSAAAGSNTRWSLTSTRLTVDGRSVAITCPPETSVPLNGSMICTATVNATCMAYLPLNAMVAVNVTANKGTTANASSGVDVPCLDQCVPGAVPGSTVPNPLPPSPLAPSNYYRGWFQLPGNYVPSCPGGVGTVTIRSPLRNGRCLGSALSWVALGAGTTTATSACFKRESVPVNGTITLTGVTPGQRVFMWAHDGSFPDNTPAFTPLTTGSFSLPNGCRSNSAKNNAGAFLVIPSFQCPPP